MTKRLSKQEKESRRPILRACTFCHSKHLQCSRTRPCQNCIKRKIADSCQDLPRKRAKYMVTDAPKEEYAVPVEIMPEMENINLPMEALLSVESFKKNSSNSTPNLNLTPTNFNSNFLNQEYLMLGDLVLRPVLPSLEFQPLVSPSLLELEDNARPFIAVNNDEPEKQYVLPLVSHTIYQTVQDIYANKIISFDYPLLYHLLTHFLKRRFALSSDVPPDKISEKRDNLLVILKCIASYRPTFISAHKSLFKPFDFQFLEMSFQRCLLDYENLSKLNALPTIIWRRTGEIVSLTNDMASLLNIDVSEVLSKRTFIMELMYDDESIVDYFRLFKLVAVGNLHLTIVTRCKLIKLDLELGYIEFCSVWTVKRDLFDLPMVIVGQFLPVLATADSRSY